MTDRIITLFHSYPQVFQGCSYKHIQLMAIFLFFFFLYLDRIIPEIRYSMFTIINVEEIIPRMVFSPSPISHPPFMVNVHRFHSFRSSISHLPFSISHLPADKSTHSIHSMCATQNLHPLRNRCVRYAPNCRSKNEEK